MSKRRWKENGLSSERTTQQDFLEQEETRSQDQLTYANANVTSGVATVADQVSASHRQR